MLLFSGTAVAQTDSLYMSIDSLTFVSEKSTSAILRSRSDQLTVDLVRLQGLPKILGNTDPLHFVKLLPAVQTTTEYNSNIYIRGCDASHNDMTIGGAPVFGVNHLLGLFSIFNPAHYPRMTFSNMSSSNRLGGTVAMDLPDTLKKKVTGDVSVGLISAQASLGLRLGRHSHLRASFRQSYVNLVYSRWLKVGDSAVKYGFGDYNLTYLYSDGKKDKVWVDVYLGQDNARLDEDNYGVDFTFGWGNYKGAVRWAHNGSEIDHNHTVYSSGYGSECFLSQVLAELRMPSYIMAHGYKGDLRWKDVSAEAEFTCYNALPQAPRAVGIANSSDGDLMQKQLGIEGSLYAAYEKLFADRWGVKAGLKAICYHNPETGTSAGLLPDIALSYDAFHAGKIVASYGWSQQNLFYTGLSNSGLPIEFWFLSGKYAKPQYAQWVDLSYDLAFCRNMLALSVGLYGKQLFNQVEYSGDLMDMFTDSYDLSSKLLHGSGYNFGLNLMLHKQSGKFTGWVSYSLGRALRRFDGLESQGWVPSNHERIHELNTVASYKYKKWDFSGTFIFASGLPFTAPKSYYISSGQLVADFGERNACRMRPYIRLDLSATYTIIKNERHENGINVSIVNAFGRRNDVMYKLRVYEDSFAYARQSFELRVIPSVSYFHKF